MIDITKGIHPLTEFKRNTTELVRQLRETRQPIVLTINGRAELVVQDAGSYQRLMDLVDRLEAIAGIRKGLEELKRGEGQPIEDAVRDIRKEVETSSAE
jgi:prevent-host-death family protein